MQLIKYSKTKGINIRKFINYWFFIVNLKILSYVYNAGRVAIALANKPQRVTSDEFNNYIKYAAEFPELGTNYLAMASAKMGFFQYYCVDVYAFLLGCLSFSIVLIYLALKFTIKKFNTKFYSKKVKQK